MQYKQWKRGNRNSSACINDVLLTIALTSDECYGQGGKLQCIRSSHIFTETFVDSLTTISFLAAVDRCWGVWVVRVYLDWESGEVVKASTTSRDQSRHIFLSTSSPTPLPMHDRIHSSNSTAWVPMTAHDIVRLRFLAWNTPIASRNGCCVGKDCRGVSGVTATPLSTCIACLFLASHTSALEALVTGSCPFRAC